MLPIECPTQVMDIDCFSVACSVIIEQINDDEDDDGFITDFSAAHTTNKRDMFAKAVLAIYSAFYCNKCLFHNRLLLAFCAGEKRWQP